ALVSPSFPRACPVLDTLLGVTTLTPGREAQEGMQPLLTLLGGRVGKNITETIGKDTFFGLKTKAVPVQTIPNPFTVVAPDVIGKGRAITILPTRS
ncbi:MAG: hypothetical protein JW762_03445, partial [Dehalococcoidales bacterium]|nr:hypothetical protein [Dehalococcoidales bacterium]